MIDIDTAGVRLESTRSPIVPPEADDMTALGFVDFGHWHHCSTLQVELDGTRMVEPARLNPTFGYWLRQDAAGRWTLASNLDGRTVIGHVERFDNGVLVDGGVYVIEHVDSADGGGSCAMVFRRVS
ncbi:hypothetical protein FHX42_005252 [Saccharopolyspora lacisalsi]|uniref:Uncharacterized protein n=1 Tax=Halosaccharopolyspora lacisalsi TaxID=1000566 RepID=A0A839E7F8_9PSEU|nr:hypothetical protein [Halosaccharopolyspora lacisalsi]MBA8827845.1 hypothetical protein [Halosaccharopolyspora lacisalsi]